MRSQPLLSVVALLGLVGGSWWLASAAPQQASAPASAAPARSATWAAGGQHERLTADNCVLALIDHQTGLTNLVHNTDPIEFKSRVLALAKTAALHRLPTVITTSAEDGANGPFLPEVLELLPDAPRIARQGQINAFDDPNFVRALEQTGRRKVVLAGITTDVCVAFAALAALDAGYEVYVVLDASGSMTPQTQEAAVTRMAAAGATIGTWFALSCELLSDWREPTGAGTAQLFVEHLPSYAEIFHSHAHRAAATPGATR
jgi:nicotinamidase-related amidase